jgi:thermitase
MTVVGRLPAAAQGPATGPSILSLSASPLDRLSGGLGTGLSGQDSLGKYQTGELVVKYQSGVSAASVAGMQDQYGITRVQSPYSGGAELWLVPEGDELAVAKQLNADPRVAYAEPNYLYHAFVSPNDPDFGKQWAHTKIGSAAAWDVTTGSASLVIAIIDTGIDENHPDLAAKLVPGYDFVDGDNNPHDENGHGTHCAGIAAAATDNGVGIAGVDWQASIMPVRVLDFSGSGDNWDVGQGIRWAYQNGANVLSLSLGGTDNSQYLRDAVDEAHAAGSLVVAAMGNERLEGNPTMYPAAYDTVMAVAATGPADIYASYSSHGPHCDIAAPGGDMLYLHDPAGVYSTMPTYAVELTRFYGYYKNYDYLHGTSQATPHVAGLASLLWSVDPTMTPDQVEEIIKTTADDLGTPGWDPDYGYGRIDSLAAVQSISTPGAPTLLPIDNADGDGSYLVDWSDVPMASSYTLQEDRNPAFPSPTELYLGANSQFMVTGRGGGTWYYRVRATSDLGDSPWSNVQSATVAPAPPTLAPINNGGNEDEYEISWSASDSALGYTLEEAGNASFSNPKTRYQGIVLSYHVTGQPEGTWYYRVRAHNSAGDGAWSNAESTAVGPAALDAPTLSSIDNTNGDGDYLVRWSEVTGATSYKLEQSRDPYFADPAEVYSGAVAEFPVVDQPGGPWYYRVRAFGPAGKSPWSNVQSTAVTVHIFLPFVVQAYRSSEPGADLQNGDFESGPVAWTEYSARDYDIIINAGFPDYVSPHSGGWAAWLGGDENEIAYIEQQVNVPAGNAYLTYWHWIDSSDFCGFGGSHFDFATVVVNGAVVELYDLCTRDNTAGWEKHAINLSAYTGQSVSLQIRVETDSSYNSNLFVDDVAFEDSPILALGTSPGAGEIGGAESRSEPRGMERNPDGD